MRAFMGAGDAGHRHHRRRWASVLFATGMVVGLVGPGATVAGASSCAPAVVEFEVNQGLDYERLAAAKAALVRVHMNAAAGCSGQQVTGGSLTVSSDPTRSFPLFQVPTSPVAAAGSGSQDDHAGDATIRVPGSSLQVPGQVTFTATLQYSGGGSSGSFVATDTATFVDAPPLRVLFVKLAPASEVATWFPSTTLADLQLAAEVAARTMPVPDGACSPIQPSTTPGNRRCGLQYSIAENAVDISAWLDKRGNFDGGKLSFSRELAPALAATLRAYNESPTNVGGLRAADLVVGFVPRSRVTGSVDGMAMMGSPESWFSLDATVGGGLLNQEAAHSLDLRAGSSFHSGALHYHGALGDPNRARNLTTAIHLGTNNFSVMRGNPLSVSGWGNATVGFERQDQECFLLRETPPVVCGKSAGVAAPAGQVLGVVGHTDLDPATKDDEFRTAVSETAGCTKDADEAPLEVVYYRDADGDGKFEENEMEGDPRPLPASNRETHPEHHSATWVVDCTVSWEQAADRIEIRVAGGGAVLWEVDASTAAPSDVHVAVRPATWNHQKLSDAGVDPAISPEVPTEMNEPRLVAWVSKTAACGGDKGLLVARRLSDGAEAMSNCMDPTPQTPAISPGGTHIAYVHRGSIKVASPNFEEKTIADEKSVYCEPVAGSTCIAGSADIEGPAADPAWDAAGNRIAFAVEQQGGTHDLAVVNVDGLVSTAKRLTLSLDIDERAPSFSHTTGEHDRIVFERCEQACSGDSPLATLLVPSSTDVSLPPITRLDVNGRRPSWGVEFIAIERDATIQMIYPPDASDPESSTQVTGPGTSFGDAGIDPSLHGNLGPIAFASRGGIWLATQAGTENEISISAADDFPETTFAHAYNVCGTPMEARPLAVGLKPTHTDGGRAFFHTRVDLTAGCGGGEVEAVVGDHEHLTANGHRPALGSAPKPHVPVITTPRPGATVVDSRVLTLDASVLDPESGAETYGGDDREFALTWHIDGVHVGEGARVYLPPGTHSLAHRNGWRTVTVTACLVDGCEVATSRYRVVADAAVDFDPDTWHVPSNGVVTMTIAFRGDRDPATATNVRITEVDGVPIDSSAWAHPAKGRWRAVSAKASEGVLTTKFDRNACTPSGSDPCLGPNTFFLSNGLVGRAVTLTVEGDTSTRPFAVFDPTPTQLSPR